MNTVPLRGRYQGALQILEFNRDKYLAAAAGFGAAIAAWPFLAPMGRAAVLVGAAPLVFWMVSSLVVSHYVYDCFPLYDLHWLSRALAHAPRRWINIHAGWDETSGLLARIFPDALGEAVDIFDRRVMTENSIERARRRNHDGVPATPACYDSLPFENGTVDTAFAIFAAHELRRHVDRVRLFKEVARTLTGNGEFVLVEHARDAWNFLAFGPGFLHFFSQRAWRQAACQAGLTVRCEFAMTPFVHVSILRRGL
jgi:SAM-dependent methyltransferase